MHLNWILYESKKRLFLPNQLLFLIIVEMEISPRPRLARFSARPVTAPFACLDQLVAACWKIKREVLELCGTIEEFIKHSRCWHLISWQVILLFGFGYLREFFCSLSTSLNEKLRMGKKMITRIFFKFFWRKTSYNWRRRREIFQNEISGTIWLVEAASHLFYG